MKQIILFLLVSLLLVSPVLAYSVPDDTIVYVTPHGEKYHTSDCSYLTTYDSMTIEEAENSGYEPCSRCDPDRTPGVRSSVNSNSDRTPLPNWLRILLGIAIFLIMSPMLLLFFVVSPYVIFVGYRDMYRKKHPKNHNPIIVPSDPIPSPAQPDPSLNVKKAPRKAKQTSKPKREPELYYVCINDPYYHRKDCRLLRDGECIVAVKFRTVFLDNTPPCPYCKPRDNYVDPSVYSK